MGRRLLRRHSGLCRVRRFTAPTAPQQRHRRTAPPFDQVQHPRLAFHRPQHRGVVCRNVSMYLYLAPGALINVQADWCTLTRHARHGLDTPWTRRFVGCRTQNPPPTGALRAIRRRPRDCSRWMMVLTVRVIGSDRKLAAGRQARSSVAERCHHMAEEGVRFLPRLPWGQASASFGRIYGGPACRAAVCCARIVWGARRS